MATLTMKPRHNEATVHDAVLKSKEREPQYVYDKPDSNGVSVLRTYIIRTATTEKVSALPAIRNEPSRFQLEVDLCLATAK